MTILNLVGVNQQENKNCRGKKIKKKIRVRPDDRISRGDFATMAAGAGHARRPGYGVTGYLELKAGRSGSRSDQESSMLVLSISSLLIRLLVLG